MLGASWGLSEPAEAKVVVAKGWELLGGWGLVMCARFFAIQGMALLLPQWTRWVQSDAACQVMLLSRCHGLGGHGLPGCTAI